MMTDELIEYLPTLKKHVSGDDKMHYSMCNYARNLKDRGDFESAMKVYNFVSGLYPNETGLLSDIASEYFMNGDMALAKKKIDEAVKNKNLDEMSLGNAFFFNSVMGSYDDALDCIKKQSILAGTSDYFFYKGLLEFSRSQDWKTTLANFNSKSQNTSWKEIADYMISDEFSSSIDNYIKLIDFKLNDGFKIIIHESFKTKTPNNLIPFINYAELLTYNKQYENATIEFKKIEKSNLIKNVDDKEKIAYFHGWVLWRLDQKVESIARWQKLKNSENFHYKSASAYFSGKYYYDIGDKQKAKTSFELVSDDASKSKYATMSWNYLNSIK